MTSSKMRVSSGEYDDSEGSRNAMALGKNYRADGLVRVVSVKTSKRIVKRAISKIYILLLDVQL